MICPRLLAVLPRDRHRPGALALVDAATERRTLLAGPWPVLGRAGSDVAGAHGNPGRDQIRPYGDTPLGLYQVGSPKRIDPDSAADRRSFGAAFVPLLPVDGPALTAATVGGRTGLGLHGGDLAEDRSSLRPTAGCLRVRAEALEAVLALLADPARRPRFLDAVEGEP